MRLLGIGYGKSWTSILSAVGLGMFGCVPFFFLSIEIPSLIHVASRFTAKLRLFDRKVHDRQPYSNLFGIGYALVMLQCFISGTCTPLSVAS